MQIETYDGALNCALYPDEIVLIASALANHEPILQEDQKTTAALYSAFTLAAHLVRLAERVADATVKEVNNAVRLELGYVKNVDGEVFA